jgi:hypothetical protein
MTDKMFDEKGLRASGETDPEKKAARDENAEVEGHRLAQFEAEKTARREGDAPDVEGHRFHAPEDASEPEPKTRLNEDEGADGEEGVRSM